MDTYLSKYNNNNSVVPVFQSLAVSRLKLKMTPDILYEIWREHNDGPATCFHTLGNLLLNVGSRQPVTRV